MNENILENFLAEMPELPEFAGISPVGVHTCGNWKSTPLHIAAIRGNVAVMGALLDAGADIQARGEHAYTPLHEAVEQGHVEAARLLLQRGASLTAKSDDGHTPLLLAQILHCTEIERLLQNHGV